MPIVRVNGVSNPIQFPDEMSREQMLAVLRDKFSTNLFDASSPISLPNRQQTIEPVDKSLAQRAGQGISDFLSDTGIISNPSRAHETGQTLSALGELLPGIGDVAAGDELGRAIAQNDIGGMLLGAVGVIPVAGDFAKKVSGRLSKLKVDGFDVSTPLFRGSTANETTGRPFTHFSKQPSVANSFSADPDLLTELGIDLSLAEDMFSGANVSVNFAKKGNVATMDDVKRVMASDPVLASKPIQESFPELEKLGFNSFDSEFETVIFNPRDFTGAFTDNLPTN